MLKKIDKLNLDFKALFAWIDSNPGELNHNDVYDPNMPFDADFRTDWEKTIPSLYSREITNFDVWRPKLLDWVSAEWLEKHNLDVDRSWCRIARTPPGRFLPPHIDICPGAPASKFTATRQEILEHNEGAVRLWIPLEDAKLGHIFFGEDWIINDWCAGDVYAWDVHEIHGLVNAGIEDRWVLLLSAYYKNI